MVQKIDFRFFVIDHPANFSFSGNFFFKTVKINPCILDDFSTKKLTVDISLKKVILSLYKFYYKLYINIYYIFNILLFNIYIINIYLSIFPYFINGESSVSEKMKKGVFLINLLQIEVW